MNHSPKFNLVKGYYVRGLWDANKVALAVTKNWITAAEYEEITGDPYPGE